MKWAYKLRDDGDGLVLSENGKPEMFSAQSFSSEKRPQGQFICTCCHEPVHWRKAYLKAGGLTAQRACWTAVSRDKHIAKNCTNISIEEYYTSLSANCSMDEAVKTSATAILLRLNLTTRDLGRYHRDDRLNNERQWCLEHKERYKSISIDFVTGFVEQINKIIHKAPEGVGVTQRIYVSHLGGIRPLSDVMVLEKQGREKLYHDMMSQQEGFPFIKGSFPCLVPFSLAYEEKPDVGNVKKIFKGVTAGHMQEVYCFSDELEFENVMNFLGGSVLAWPYLNARNPGKLMWYVHDISNLTDQHIISLNTPDVSQTCTIK